MKHMEMRVMAREMPWYYEFTKRWIFVTHNFVRFSSQNSPDRLVRHHSQIDKGESHITYKIAISSLEILRACEFDWWWMLAFPHRLKLTGVRLAASGSVQLT